jgi:hypothetical protein
VKNPFSFARLACLCLTARLDRPVFLTGCGRSGTTILGEVLGKHRTVTYLNEPRERWIAAYPRTDIWSDQAASRSGSMVLTANSCTWWRSRLLTALFMRETRRTGRPRLLEKLPINNFRLEFIRKIFPDALFIHIVRNGLDVAESIARECQDGRWFNSGYKWNALVRFAQQHEDYKKLPALCQSDFDRGLLEWRLSVEAAQGFYRSCPKEIWREVRYEDLLEKPVETLQEIEQFMGLPPAPEMHRFGAENLRQRKPKLRQPSDSAMAIGGDLLRKLGYS